MSLYNRYKSVIDNFISNDINNINNYNIKEPLISIILLYTLEKKFININNKIINLALLIESTITLIKDYSTNIFNDIQYLQKLIKYNQLIINIYSEIVKFNNDNKCHNGYLIINNAFDILNNNIIKSNMSLISNYQAIFEMSFLLIWNLLDNKINNMLNYKLTGNYLGILYKIYIDIDEQDNLDINLNMFKLNDTKELMDYYMNYQEQFLNYIFKIDLFNNEELIDEILNKLSNNISLIS